MSIIVNGKEYPDERSVPEQYRMQTQMGTRQRDPGNFSPDLAPNVGRSILPHVTTFSGMMSTLARTYRQHDEAIRHNKHNANMMRRDPMIMGPLFARQMAVALLQWQIQPEDSSDDKQVQVAKELTFMVSRIPRFREYLRNLMEAVWYGRYGIQNVWGFTRDSRGVRYRTVVDWVPVNGDKLLFRYDDGTGRYDHDEIGIKVSVAHVKDDIWAGKPDIEWNSEGTGVFLRRWERSRLVVHKNFMMDGDYEDPTTAGMIHGVGLRHFLYWSWYQKQETLAQLAEVVERAGMGFTVYTYPAGNAQAREEVERLAEEQAHKNQIVLPMEVSNPDAYSIQQIPPNTQGIMALQSLIDDYFGSWIIKFILGQTLSYRAEAGTPGISDLHRDSFLQIVKYDSLGVEETVTKDLIRMLLMFNFPSYQNVNFQFKLNTEEAVPLEKLQALQAAWSMGAKIKSEDVMGLIGLNVAGDTDQALYNPQVLASLKEYEQMEEQQEKDQGQQGTQITESQDQALAAMLGPVMQSKKYAKDEEKEAQEDEVPSIEMDLHELSWDPYESKDAHKRVVDHLRSMGMDEDADKLDSLNFMHRTDLWDYTIPNIVDAVRGNVQGFDHEGHREKKAELAKLSDAYTGHVDDLLKRMFNVGHGNISEEYSKKSESGNYKPTKGMIGNAKRGLELRKKHEKGGTAVGVARARDIINGKGLSFSTVKRMHSFFSRHAGNEEGGEDDAGYIAWLLWGGDSGRNWARSIVEAERKNAVPLSALSDNGKDLGPDPGDVVNPDPGVVSSSDPSVIDTPREGDAASKPSIVIQPDNNPPKSTTGSIFEGIVEGAMGGVARRMRGQPDVMYAKDDQPSYEATEEDFENPEIEILEYQSLKTPQEYIDHAHNHFGQTDDIMSSNFVHPDGSMSARAEGMSDLNDQADHIRSIKKVFESYSPDTVKGAKDRGFRSVRHFQRFGSMPLIHDDDSNTSYAEIRSDLTDTQYDLIKSMLEKGRKVHVSILDKTKDDEAWRGTLTDPDQVDDFKKQVKARTLEKGQPYDFDVNEYLTGSPISAVNLLMDSRVMAPNTSEPGKVPTTRDAYLYIQKLTGQFYNKLDEDTEENNKAIEDALFDEGIFALSKDSDAMGWYERTFKKAQEAYFEAFPELEKNKGDLAVFNAIMMFTSNGATVETNHRVAFDLYNKYRDSKDGKVSEDYPYEGKEIQTLEKHAYLINKLVEKFGSTEAFSEFMEKKFTANELKQELALNGLPELAKDLDFGELVSTELRGSNIFGPKLGSFYNNLNQNHETVTMDRWFTRTYKRIMGTLTDVNYKKLQGQLDRLSLRFNKHNVVDKDGNPVDAAQYLGRGSYKTEDGESLKYSEIREGIKQLRKGGNIDRDNAAVKYVSDRYRIFKRKDASGKTFPVSKRTEENYAAKNVYENLFGLVDAPEGGQERDRIRKIMNNVRDRMSSAGFDMSLSDLQALLWYHEKRLLPHVGVVDDRQLPDDYARQARIEVDKYLGRIKKSGPEKSAPQRVQSDEPRFGLSTKNSRRQSSDGYRADDGERGKGEVGGSEETLTDEEAYEQIALAVQDIVRSALQEKMQPERNAMGAGPRDHSPEDLDVTNKQINGQATANRGTMPKQAAPSTMPPKAGKGSVSTSPVSKTGMSSDATRMDRGASLDNMRDKFMKYSKVKLIEMLQPYVQEEPNFSLTDAQGKKRRTSLFKADKYSLANALAERYAQQWETPAKDHPDLFTSDYAGITETLKPYKADDQLRDDLFDTSQKVYEQHLSDVNDFNSSYQEAMSRITPAGKRALGKARRGDGTIDPDKIQGLDKVVQEIEEGSKNYLGLKQGYGEQAGSLEDHVFEMLKGGKRLKRRPLSRKNYEDALELIKQRNPGGLESLLRDEPLPDPSEIKVSSEAGQGQQQEFEMAPYLTPEEEQEDALEFAGESSKSDPGSEGRVDYAPEGEGISTAEIMELQEDARKKAEEEDAAQKALLEASAEQAEEERGIPARGSEPSEEDIARALTPTEIEERQAAEDVRGRGAVAKVAAETEGLQQRGKESIGRVASETEGLRQRGQQAIQRIESAREARADEIMEAARSGRAKELEDQRRRQAMQGLIGMEVMNRQLDLEADEIKAKQKEAEKEWNNLLGKARRDRQFREGEEKKRLKSIFESADTSTEQYHMAAIPHVDRDIKVSIKLNGKTGNNISFVPDPTGESSFAVRLEIPGKEPVHMTADKAKEFLGDKFNDVLSIAIKKDNKRWTEKAELAGLAAPFKDPKAGTTVPASQIYFTRSNKAELDSHVLTAMRNLGPGAGGIDINDYSNNEEAAKAAYQKMRGHLNDIQEPGGYFDSLKGIGFQMNDNASTGENYLNGIQFVVDKASKTGFKPDKRMNSIENMQKAFEHVAKEEGKLPTWAWVAGGIGALAMLALFYSIFRD